MGSRVHRSGKPFQVNFSTFRSQLIYTISAQRCFQLPANEMKRKFFPVVPQLLIHSFPNKIEFFYCFFFLFFGLENPFLMRTIKFENCQRKVRDSSASKEREPERKSSSINGLQMLLLEGATSLLFLITVGY